MDLAKHAMFNIGYKLLGRQTIFFVIILLALIICYTHLENGDAQYKAEAREEPKKLSCNSFAHIHTGIATSINVGLLTRRTIFNFVG